MFINKTLRNFKKNISTYEKNQNLDLNLLPKNADEMINNFDNNLDNDINLNDNLKPKKMAKSINLLHNDDNFYNNNNINNNIKIEK